jgi:hypothetical protein
LVKHVSFGSVTFVGGCGVIVLVKHVSFVWGDCVGEACVLWFSGWVWGDCVGEACVLWFSYVAAAISVWPKITVMGPKNENAMAGHV